MRRARTGTGARGPTGPTATSCRASRFRRDRNAASILVGDTEQGGKGFGARGCGRGIGDERCEGRRKSTTGRGGGLGFLLVQIALIFGVFYFLILRPQAQARKKHAELLSALKKGDEVVTAGGLMGKVRDIKEDRITIESGTASVVVHRQRIVQVGGEAAPTTT